MINGLKLPLANQLASTATLTTKVPGRAVVGAFPPPVFMVVVDIANAALTYPLNLPRIDETNYFVRSARCL